MTTILYIILLGVFATNPYYLIYYILQFPNSNLYMSRDLVRNCVWSQIELY